MGTLQPEALLVDDLLDFSCGDIGGLCEEGDDFAPPACEQSHVYSASHAPAVISSALARPSDHSQETETSELLHAPPEELADELEWLSTFVEDSYRGKDQSMPLVSSEQWFSKGGSSRKEGWCPENPSLLRATFWLRMDDSGIFCQILEVGSSPLIGRGPGGEPAKEKRGWDKKGRSKRLSRSGGRVWSLQTVVRERGFEEEDDDEEEHSQTSSLDYEPFDRDGAGEERAPLRKRAKKEQQRAGGGGEEGRRCAHCQVQKTPQWRAGPLGPKTLCNACGVRFKSGRLLPEYRPAASPTFVNDLHSNSHKKVLEMRSSKLDPVRHSRLHRPPPPQDQQELSSSTCSQESTTSPPQQH